MATSPTVVELVFNEPVLGIGTAVRVTGPGGDVTQGKAGVVDARVRQQLKAGAPAGKYTVSWRVTSADGHPISDSFSYTARAGGTPAPTPPETGPVAVDTAGGDDEPNWTAIVLWGAAGAAVGTAYVLIRRRRAGGDS